MKKSIFQIHLVTVVLIAAVIAGQIANAEAMTTQTGNTLKQGEVIPQIKVQDIVFDQEQPEEGKQLNGVATIANADPRPYANVTFIVSLKEVILNLHRQSEAQEYTVANMTIDSLPANSTIEVEFSFIPVFGQYTLTASLGLDGVQLPSSVYGAIVQVISPPIGDDQTLEISLGLLFLVLLVLLAIPSVTDTVRRRRSARKIKG